MTSIDHNLFLILNFDGGVEMDAVMLAISGIAMWLPLYALIAYLVWRRGGIKGLIIFLILVGAAVGLSDIVAGVFKHSGLLKNALPELTPRLRPMFEPALEGLSITADSLAAVRREGAIVDWAVHVPQGALAGRYGTVSAHAATQVAMVTLSAMVVKRRWFTILMVAVAILVSYSRIYLAKHYPLDILWGTAVGLLFGFGAWMVYKRVLRGKQ